MNKGSLAHIAALASVQRHRSAAIISRPRRSRRRNGRHLEVIPEQAALRCHSHGWQNGPPREGAWPDRWAIARELGDRCFSGRRLLREPSSFGGSGTMWIRNSLEDVQMRSCLNLPQSMHWLVEVWLSASSFFYMILLQNPKMGKERDEWSVFLCQARFAGGYCMSHVTLVKSRSNLYSTAFIPNSWHVQTNCLIGLCKSYQLDLNNDVLSCFYVLTRLILCGCSPASPFLSVEPRPGDLAVSWPARERWSDQRLWISHWIIDLT